jgi:hypothetical protein
MRLVAPVVVLALVACGDRGRSAPVAKAVDTPAAVPPDAGVDALTDDQRNAIALEAFLAADRLATDSRRAVLDAKARQPAAIQVVMRWLDTVYDGVPADDPVLALPLTRDVSGWGRPWTARDVLNRLLATHPEMTSEIVPPERIAGAYRSRGLRDLPDAVHVQLDLIGHLEPAVEYATLTFAVVPDARGRLVIKGLEIDAPWIRESGD